MKKILFVLLLNCAAFSNDCSVVFGRNDEVVGVKAKNISMREEEIVITLRNDYYEVDVTFDFFNSGAAENVKLGFPVEGGGSAFSNFRDKEVYDFKSYINGKIIPHTTKTDTISEGFNEYVGANLILWFIRNVTFPANSRTVSRVNYKAKYNSRNCFAGAKYIYGTGRHWKDGIGKMTVVINHGDDVVIEDVRIGKGRTYQGAFFGGVKAKSSKFIWEADGKYKYVFENVNPADDEESITINADPTSLYGKFGGHFSNHPEGIWVEYLGVEMYNAWLWSDYLLYDDPADIRLYTKNQIRLFINFFFAKHGYNFKNPLYREYFQKMESFGYYTGDNDNQEAKYKVNPNFKESDFNEIENKNIAYLLKLEQMIAKAPVSPPPKAARSAAAAAAPAVPVALFTDSRDGKAYKTVKIGSQTWMAENLNYAAEGSRCYGEGGSVYRGNGGEKLSDAEIKANCVKYGHLYDWETAKRACPAGWRLPSKADWDTLVNFVGDLPRVSKKLKSRTGWYNHYDGGSAGNGTDEYGFSALPGGHGFDEGSSFMHVGKIGYWWSTYYEDNTYGRSGRYINHKEVSYDGGGFGGWADGSGGVLYSVRCVRDTGGQK